MPPFSPKRKPLRLISKNLVIIGLFFSLAVDARALEATHALDIQLNPKRARLSGVDRIAISGHSGPLMLSLGARIVIERLTVNGVEADYDRRGHWITLDRPASPPTDDLQLTIQYHGRFDDPAPDDPVNTDNPGFGVTGTISPRGTLLLAGAGWYPSVAGARERFRIQVTGPPGMVALTAGRAVPAPSRPGFSVTAWQIDNPVERLALVANRFTVRTQAAGHLQAATYFIDDDSALSDQYLNASLQYLGDYEALFGRYPFTKFAVVENFFPTGYGFPSYTLIGGRVLRLPFIIPTSLRHEIAHCWWGNGVLVDYAGGNWSEGLTTYVSDYRFRELSGTEAARDSRRQMLRNFTELVPPDKDFPLTRFTSRSDPLTKAVGYDKATMVFHMLRQGVGDAIFWTTLKQIARERMFKTTSWRDIQTAFEAACGCSLDVFFRQWVQRTGAPQLSLDAIVREKIPSGTRVRGIIRQQAPVFTLDLPLRLSSAASVHTEKISVDAEQTPFDIRIPFVPQRLEVDPAFDFFRRLAPEEMPPTINRLKSARDILVVLPDGPAADRARATASRLGRALGTERLEMITAAQWSPQTARRPHIVFMQTEGITSPIDLESNGLTVTTEAFSLNAASYERRGHTYFGIHPHPGRPEGFMAFYLFGREEDRHRIATKVPHYGRYSYLVFETARNVAKGTWPAVRSPLIHAWSPENPSKMDDKGEL